MREKDLIRQLKELKKIQPNKNWAVLARQDLLNNINHGTGVNQPIKKYKRFLQPSFALASFLIIGSMLLLWTRFMGKDTHDSTYAQRAQMLEVLTEFYAEEEPSVSSQAEVTKDNVPNKVDNPNQNGAADYEEVLTSLRQADDPTAVLKQAIQQNLSVCQNESLREEARNLLNQGDLNSLINAFIASAKCAELAE